MIKQQFCKQKKLTGAFLKKEKLVSSSFDFSSIIIKTMKQLIQQFKIDIRQEHLLGLILFFILIFSPGWIHRLAPTAAWIDAGIWSLLLLSILTFLVLLSISYWLIKRSWALLGLPSISSMVLQFRFLSLWQQFVFYWLCFALLLLSSILCLIAVF